MSFLESEKSKAIRWFRNFADLLESGKAELLPDNLTREDYGNELRLSGTIIPAKKPSSFKVTKKSATIETKVPEETLGMPPSFVSKMTPSHAQQCYRKDERDYLCPKCNKFTTTSETGLKKHFNRCKG